MRLLAFLTVTAIFVAANVAGAATFVLLGKGVLALWPGAEEEPFVWLVVSLAAVAVGIAVAYLAVRGMSRA